MNRPCQVLAMLVAAFSALTAPMADDRADNREKARELYEAGNAHYAAGRYEKAAEAFQLGYELSELPGFLYNLANAYERMGQYRKAAQKLELYLKSPKAKDVVSVQERIRRLRAAADDRDREEQQRREREKRARRQARLRGETKSVEPTYEAGPRSPAYLYVLGGGGVALVGAGVFGLLSRSASTSAAEGCRGGICSREAEADLDREKRYALVADVSLALGVGLVGVSAYLYLRGPPRKRGERDSVTVAPTVGADLIGVSAVGRF